MKRRLVIDGNAVYEIDEECVLKKLQREENKKKEENKKREEKGVHGKEGLRMNEERKARR